MNPITSDPQPDLDDAYGFPFNVWQFLPTNVPKARQKPDWTLTARAARSRLSWLQVDPDRPTILRIVEFALRGVES